MCQQWKKHNESARIISHYKMDSENKSEEKAVYLSVDMQKVIMLPRISGVIIALFTKRLIIFHETFAPLPGKSRGKPFGAMWHEGVGGRSEGSYWYVL